jgi:hypothetical protein
VCLLCCCPPGAVTTETNVSPNESIDSGERGGSRSDKVSYITRGPFVQPFQLGVKGAKADSGRERQRPEKVLYTTGVAL